MMKKKASGMISPPGRVPSRALDPPDLGTMVAAATDGFVEY